MAAEEQIPLWKRLQERLADEPEALKNLQDILDAPSDAAAMKVLDRIHGTSTDPQPATEAQKGPIDLRPFLEGPFPERGWKWVEVRPGVRMCLVKNPPKGNTVQYDPKIHGPATRE
jgi:hypothetical protein